MGPIEGGVLNDRPVLRIAVPVPLLQVFDYWPPAGSDAARLRAGCRVAVPFGRGRRVGILIEVATHPDIAPERIRPALALLDDEPLLTGEAADAVRARARSQGFTERESHFMDRGSDWDDVRQSAGNMSLFGSRRLVEIRLPTGKPGTSGNKALVDLLGRGVHGARSIVVADAAAQILRRCVFGPAPHDSIAHSWHRGVSSRHYTISLKAVTCKDIGGRGGDRTHDRWCVNAFDQHLWRLSVPILYPYVQLSGVLSSNPSTDTQAVRARLGTLLAQTGVWSTCARLPNRTQTFSHGWTGHYLRGSARHRPPRLTSSRHGTSTGMIICARSVSGALRRWSRWKL